MKVEHIVKDDQLIHKVDEQKEKNKGVSNMDLTRILTKSAEGDFEEQFFSEKQLQDFFIKNTDKDGTVTKEIVMFDDAEFEVIDEKDFKATEQKPGRIEMIMSDPGLDRHRERMDQSGWKLANYRKNPVMLFGHSQQIPAIGIMENVKVQDDKLRGFPKFDTRENDPFAGMIAEKLEKRIIRAGSVGFRVIRVEMIENEKDPTRFIIREMELFEFSIVNVPALPSALSRRVSEKEKTGIDALKKTVEENSMMAREREKEISKEIDERVKKCMEEIKASVKELEDLKTEVLANKSKNVNNLFDDIVGQQTSGSKSGQQTSDPAKAQQTSELEGIVSE